MRTLTDQVAIITGASTGIGRALAIMLDRAGAHLIVIGRDAGRLDTMAARLTRTPLMVAGDIADARTIERARDTALAAHGRVDILLANAGLYLPDRGWEVPSARVDELVTTNVLGVMHSVHALLPHFIDRGTGDIVVTSSVSGHQVIPWEPLYSATKHAIQAFVHGTRQQLLNTGIRLGAVAPGIVLNELWGVSADEAIDDRIAEGRGMRSEDVADAVHFMLTRPRHVTIRDLVMLPTNQEI